MLLNDEYIAIFLQKFVDIELGLLEIFENVAGVWFLCVTACNASCVLAIVEASICPSHP